MQIAVVGAGIGGLWAALLLGKGGHDVLLLEQDALERTMPPAASPYQARPGAGQSLQPHLFLAGAHAEIVREAPDLLSQLLGAGAYLHDQTAAFPGLAPRDDDWQLRVICCRRLVFEDVLREAVGRERRVEVRSGVRVRGLQARPGSLPVVTGVITNLGPISAEATVLATGRGPLVRHWLGKYGVTVAEAPTIPSGLTHFSRHYLLSPDVAPDLSRWPLGGPHGECAGYSFHLFVGDNDTFSLLQAIRPGDRELRILRHAEAFAAAARSIPAVRRFLEAATPVTPVLPFGGVANTFRDLTRDGLPVVHGLFVMGDALSQTNSFYGYGVTVAMRQGTMLSRLLEPGADLAESAFAYYTEGVADARSRYLAASSEDLARQRYWNGAVVDAGPLHERRLMQSAARHDPTMFRAVLRRTGALDPVDALQANPELMRRATELEAHPATPARLTRPAILAAARSALPASPAEPAL